ncbi:MAG TPA: GNAT family N-acetyltransferase [Longimicrobium sp.]|jgi:predicted N-acetyltransferase YhbS
MPITLRPFGPGDVPCVAELRRRVFRRGRRTGPGELERYLQEIFFENPWRDPGLPGWVADEDGAVVGFVGVIPRPLARGGEALRGAVVSQFFVAPERRGFVGVRLLQKVMAGAQDLLYHDVVSPDVARLWELVGGSVAHACGFAWTRPLRPARHAAARLGSAPLVRGARLMARPLLGVIDALAAPAVLRAEPPCTAEPLADLRLIVDALPELVSPRAIRPVYDADRLKWLLARAEERWSGRRIERQVVRAEDGAPAGWFLYLTAGGGTADLLQAHAAPGRHADVLRHLFRHAHRTGAIAVRGRLDPAFQDDLHAAGVSWERASPGILVHARDPDLLAAVLRGDALLSGLDGGWWLDF